MRRKRNWILKRLVLGFAVAALVVPSAAIAAVDEGGAGQPNSSGEIGTNAYVPFVTDFPKYEVASNVNGPYGIPGISRGTRTDYAGNDYVRRATLSDQALRRGDAIEVARTHPRNVVSADIENVRLQPRSAVSADIENVRLQPRTTSAPEVAAAGFDWGDAGVGAGIVFGLVLVGGAAFYGTRYLAKPQTA
jgi:hypothetical protein